VDKRWILGGVLVAGGVGLVRAFSSRPRFDNDSRVLLIGDSLAVGMDRYFRDLAEEAELPYLSGAIGGTRTDQWANSNWLRRKLEEFSPSHVLISLGTNDAYTPKSSEDTLADAQEINDLIENVGATPIWIGAPLLPRTVPCPSCPKGTLDIRVENLEVIRDAAPYFYDSTDIDIPRSPDGIHPTAIGYAGWAGDIWHWLT